MKEPILIVELLISGLLTATWMLLGVAYFVGAETILTFFNEMSVGLVAILALYCYAIGIVGDRFWDFCTKPRDLKIRAKHFPSNEEFSVARSQLLHSSSEAASFFDYIRMRLRIARSLVCNVPLIFLSSMILIWFRLDGLEAIHDPRGPGIDSDSLFRFKILVTCLLTLLLIGTQFAFRNISNSYYKQMKYAIEANKKDPG